MSKKNNVRSSQLLSPFGVGQIVNFPKELSLMVCGLNLWDEKITQGEINRGKDSIDRRELHFSEPRLEKVLDVEYFVKPFEYKTAGNKNNYLEIPAVRFPGWHYCTNHKCGRMILVSLTQADEKIECISCWDGKSKYKWKMNPVRFVAACPSGHIQDVPFKEWVHNGVVPNDGLRHEISYQTGGGSGDLGSIHMKCTCGERRSLAGLMNIRKDDQTVFDSALARIGLDDKNDQKFDPANPNDNNQLGQYCKGHKPWLGIEGIINANDCNNHLQVLIRGAANVHFSEIQSAIYLPSSSEDSNEYVNKVIDELTKDKLRGFYDVDDGLVLLPAILESQSVVKNGCISKEDLLSGVLSELHREEACDDISEMSAELKLKLEEYKYILKGRDSENSDLKAIVKTFEGYDDQSRLQEYFDSVVLIEKLKETRVFKGFSRINPMNKINKRDLSNKPVKWLPAVEVYGEGIFLKFNDKIVDTWLKEHGAKHKYIIERYYTSMRKRRPQEEDRNINPFFVVMHTFAHLLIKKLCFDCGYGSSSLREKLYFCDDPESRMNGILIYTSSGDSEGSLGGLVRQGNKANLGPLIKNAIAESEWCSADPVCSDIGKTNGQGPDSVNGAACHNCCILPETSCEEFNMLLDRTALIGTLDNPEIGLFNRFVN
jgi:hypothetical protein